ncbi:uncharacterized protein LOC143644080 [Tamandua tetradactyla]|uniref:uncharacterized protein LOC143644080 n=1 Tax=Tamandua tetradactyla TaxID=48850 RepID=UPI00405468EA
MTTVRCKRNGSLGHNGSHSLKCSLGGSNSLACPRVVGLPTNRREIAYGLGKIPEAIQIGLFRLVPEGDLSRLIKKNNLLCLQSDMKPSLPPDTLKLLPLGYGAKIADARKRKRKIIHELSIPRRKNSELEEAALFPLFPTEP